ncbi:MAG: histidine kinase [Pseudomonadota bacterium]
MPALHAATPASAVPAARVLPGLPRLLMRRAAAVGAVVLLLALALGLARMGDDMADEVDAAMALAAAMATLGQLPQAGDAQALALLAAVGRSPPLRHLVLQVHAADGRPLLAPPAAGAEPWWLRGPLALHRRWLSQPDVRQVAWVVARPAGPPWRVTLAASHEAERREAMASLVGSLLLLLAAVLGLLLVLRWNLRHALAPLGRLLAAIDGIEHQGPAAVLALPAMPVHELESVAAALRHLGQALAAAEQRRRLLSQQMLTLQDDERARLARELHDEFGQHLTALRVDAAWLVRRLAGEPALQQVAEGMAQQCALVQQDIRALLTRLQPFGPVAAQDAAQHAGQAESLARGVALLQALVDSWQGSGPEPGLACSLHLAWHDASGQALPWPGDGEAQALCLPRALWLTLYRISQEALTNVARHAGAGSAGLRLRLQGGQQPGGALRVDWVAWDDGCGLPEAGAVLPRGNGLAGLQERVWAQGAVLHSTALQADPQRPGLRLAASFHTRLLLPPAAPG